MGFIDPEYNRIPELEFKQSMAKAGGLSNSHTKYHPQPSR
jgi:hypothetical protein